jgi:hypothetical protein
MANEFFVLSIFSAYNMGGLQSNIFTLFFYIYTWQLYDSFSLFSGTILSNSNLLSLAREGVIFATACLQDFKE